MAQSNKDVSFHVVLVEVSIVTKSCFFFLVFSQTCFLLTGCESSSAILKMVRFAGLFVSSFKWFCWSLIGALRCDSWMSYSSGSWKQHPCKKKTVHCTILIGCIYRTTPRMQSSPPGFSNLFFSGSGISTETKPFQFCHAPLASVEG